MAWDVSSVALVVLFLVLLAPLLFGIVLVLWSVIDPPEDSGSSTAPADMDAPSSGDAGGP